MTFAALAVVLEDLEKTSSRNAIVEKLAILFRKLNPQETEKVAYLTQGRIAPFFAPVEIGLGEKYVGEAIARASGAKREDVLAAFRKKGDLGIVAQAFRKKAKAPVKHLSILDVVQKLEHIARTGGAGSVDRRLTMLADLLKDVDALSSKHLVRIPLGTLRLGIGDPTILDALSFAKTGDKSLRKALEAGYNRTSDLGLVAKTFWKDGLSAVEHMKTRVGSPVRPELAERLPSPQKVIEKMGKVAIEPKFDGFRTQIHLDRGSDWKVRIFSRNLEDMSHMFPDLIDATLEQVKAETAILDAEAMAYNPDSEEFYPFQETAKRRRKHGITEKAKELPLKAFIFDLLYINGKDIMDEQYVVRRKSIQEHLKKGPGLLVTEEIVTDDPKELEQFLLESVQNGLEGVVVKRLDAPYSAGARNFNWVKLKRDTSGELNDTVDGVILGYITGRGKRITFGAGALLVGVYDKERDEFVTICKIGTGLTDEEWREIHKRVDKIKVSKKPPRVRSNIEPSVWVRPSVVIEVLADEITRSPLHTCGKTETEPGYALRFPRLISFRDKDKRAEDATTVKEIISMFSQQGKKSQRKR